MVRVNPRLDETGVVAVAHIDPDRHHSVQRVVMPRNRHPQDAEPRGAGLRHRLQAVARHGEQRIDRVNRREPDHFVLAGRQLEAAHGFHPLDLQLDRRQIGVAQWRIVATAGWNDRFLIVAAGRQQQRQQQHGAAGQPRAHRCSRPTTPARGKRKS